MLFTTVVKRNNLLTVKSTVVCGEFIGSGQSNEKESYSVAPIIYRGTTTTRTRVQRCPIFCAFD